MDWDSLDAAIPRERVPTSDADLMTDAIEVIAVDGHVVHVAVPGRRWADTDPPGGDFEVSISDPSGPARPFSYGELFAQLKVVVSETPTDVKLAWIQAIGGVLNGEDPATVSFPVAAILPHQSCLLLFKP